MAVTNPFSGDINPLSMNHAYQTLPGFQALLNAYGIDDPADFSNPDKFAEAVAAINDDLASGSIRI